MRSERQQITGVRVWTTKLSSLVCFERNIGFPVVDASQSTEHVAIDIFSLRIVHIIYHNRLD